jgi:hypothetical protein
MDQITNRDDISGAPRMNRFELGDLEEMLAETSPVVLRKLRPSATQGEINPFTAASESIGFKTPLDVEKRLAEMTYMGGNDAAIHGTQVSVTASLLNAGREIDEVVSLVLAATKAAAGEYGSKWNWKREEKAIRGMCATWQAKRAKDTAPTKGQLQRQETQQRADAVVDWTTVAGFKDWLTVSADLPKDAGAAAELIVDHVGGLTTLVTDFKHAGLQNAKPFKFWTNVQATLAMALLAADGMSNEKVALPTFFPTCRLA